MQECFGRELKLSPSPLFYKAQLCMLYIQHKPLFSVVVIVVCSTIYAIIDIVRLPQKSVCAYWWFRAIWELFTLSVGCNR
jgi:hypothetical protein